MQCYFVRESRSIRVIKKVVVKTCHPKEPTTKHVKINKTPWYPRSKNASGRLYRNKTKWSTKRDPFHTNYLDVTERLVGTLLLVVGVGHGVLATVGRGGRVRGVRAVRVGTSADGLIGVRGLFGSDTAGVAVLVAIGRAAGATADAEGPENGAEKGEDDGQPSSGEHVLANVDGDAVGLEEGTGGAVDDGEEHCRGDGGGSCEEEEDDGDEGGDAAAPATADGEHADEQFDDAGDEGDQVGDEHPLGDGLVDLHDLVVVVGQLILELVVVAQAPDGERVEVELGLGLGALLGGVVAVVNLALAVAPETDGVVVGEGGVILQGLECIGDLVGSDGADVVLAEEVLDFGDCFGAVAANILQVDLGEAL